MLESTQVVMGLSMHKKEIRFVALIMFLLFCFYYVEISLLHRTFLAPLTCKRVWIGFVDY